MQDRTLGSPPTSPELLALVERAKSHVMTAAERRAQRLSWVRGQTGLSTEQILQIAPALGE